MSNARVLADRLAELLSREHGAMAEFLVALADFDRQRGWEELGYSSLFWFLHRRLRLSKSAAHSRNVASKLIQEHSDVLVALREAAELTASIRPVENPPLRDLVTAVMTARPAATSVDAYCDSPVMVLPAEPLLRVSTSATPPVTPLTEDLRRLHMTVSRRFLSKLDSVRDALSHSHPVASTEVLLEVGLDLILTRHRKRRGIEAAPRAGGRKADPSRISAEVKREVWARDEGRCRWPLEGGGICGSTLRLEVDHVLPRGRGGASDAANLRLLCRFHNQFTARQEYGSGLMDRFAARVPRACEPVAAWRCCAAA